MDEVNMDKALELLVKKSELEMSILSYVKKGKQRKALEELREIRTIERQLTLMETG